MPIARASTVDCVTVEQAPTRNGWDGQSARSDDEVIDSGVGLGASEVAQIMPFVGPTRRVTLGSTLDLRSGDEVPVESISISAGEIMVEVLTYGATLRRVVVADRDGRLANIVLTPRDWTDLIYDHDCAYMGSTIGPVANRIAGARYEMGGRVVQLPANDPSGANLHSGPAGCDRLVWDVERLVTSQDAGSAPGAEWVTLELTTTIPDGHGGIPGPIELSATFDLDPAGLTIRYAATTAQLTPISMTNHAYWTLSGRPQVGDHQIRVLSEGFVTVDHNLIPTGSITAVHGAPFDLRWGVLLADRLRSFALDSVGGFDHCFVLDDPDLDGVPAVVVEHERSGRSMTVWTDQPSVQLYTANHLDGVDAEQGPAGRHGGLCIETQHFIDAVHHSEFVDEHGRSHPTDVWLDAGERYVATTRYEFGLVD